MASREALPALVDVDFQLEFADSIRRGLAQADAGDTVVCRDYAEMVEIVDRR